MLRLRDFSKNIIMVGIPIILVSCLLLSACSGVTVGKNPDDNSSSDFGEDTATSSAISDWLNALEEWDNSSTSGGSSDSKDSLESDNNGTSSSNSNSTTTSNDKASYENGGNWTQGWY